MNAKRSESPSTGTSTTAGSSQASSASQASTPPKAEPAQSDTRTIPHPKPGPKGFDKSFTITGKGTNNAHLPECKVTNCCDESEALMVYCKAHGLNPSDHSFGVTEA